MWRLKVEMRHFPMISMLYNEAGGVCYCFVCLFVCFHLIAELADLASLTRQLALGFA